MLWKRRFWNIFIHQLYLKIWLWNATFVFAEFSSNSSHHFSEKHDVLSHDKFFLAFVDITRSEVQYLRNNSAIFSLENTLSFFCVWKICVCREAFFGEEKRMRWEGKIVCLNNKLMRVWFQTDFFYSPNAIIHPQKAQRAHFQLNIDSMSMLLLITKELLVSFRWGNWKRVLVEEEKRAFSPKKAKKTNRQRFISRWFESRKRHQWTTFPPLCAFVTNFDLFVMCFHSFPTTDCSVNSKSHPLYTQQLFWLPNWAKARSLTVCQA